MMGLEFTGEVPFDDVHIHAVIQAPDGRRMSKSLGTGIDPLDLINGGPRPPVFPQGGDFPAYGADALRWGLLAMASSQDVRFSEEKVAQGQQLTNKLWNASRLILLRIDPAERAAIAPATVEDRWILSRLERATSSVRRADRELRLLPRGARALRLRLRGAVRLVSRAGQASPLRRGPRRRPDAAARADPDAGARAPDDPVRDRGDLRARPRRARAAGRGLVAGGRRPRSTRRPSAPLGQAIEAVRALRGWRDHAGVKAGVRLSARLAADGYEDDRRARRAAGPGRVLRGWRGAGGGGPGSRRRGRDPGQRGPRPRGGGAQARGRAGADRDGDRAPRAKLANQGFVEKAPPDVVQAERDKLERLKSDLEAL